MHRDFQQGRYAPRHLEALTLLKSMPLPDSSGIVGRMVMLAIVGFILFLSVTPWVQTSYGTGRITALSPNDREQFITAMVSGRIHRWNIQEGDVVKEGDLLVEIVDNDPLLIQRLENERNASGQKYEVSKIAAETSKLNYSRQKELFREGLSSQKEVEDAKIRYKQKLSEEAQAAAELQKAEIKLARQATQKIHAPMDAVVVRINAANSANLVSEGQVLAKLVPLGARRAAEIYVDGNDVPLIYSGRDARLQFEGWPVVQFSGWPSVAVGTFAGEVAVVDAVASANGMFRVLIVEKPDQPWPDSQYLRLGARVNGWILMETVQVGYELWRKLNNFPPEMRPQPTPISPEKQNDQ